MTNLLQFLLTGILVGGVYALIALGLVLIYKSSRVFNFAQGDLVMLGGFVTWTLVARLGLPLWASLPVALALAWVAGLLVERLALRPLIGQPILAAVMVTLALSYFFKGFTILLWSADRRVFPEFFPTAPVKLGEIVLSQHLLWTFVVSVLAFGLLTIFFWRTKAGLLMRAAAEDHQVAQSMGISVKGVFAFTWSIAAMVATLGGLLLGSINGVDPTLGAIGLKAFPAVLVGGLESIPGALIGGLTVGIVEGLAAGFIDPSLGEIAPFLVLLLILLFKPQGLFGLKRIERV
ncbi:MAG: branched-chain amino acid ABC transporter permease [Chloroflexota bacterium]